MGLLVAELHLLASTPCSDLSARVGSLVETSLIAYFVSPAVGFRGNMERLYTQYKRNGLGTSMIGGAMAAQHLVDAEQWGG